MDANPLLSFVVDVNAIPQLGENEFASRTVELPLTLRFNDQTATQTASVTIEKQGNTLTLSLQADVSLSALGLILSETEKNSFENHFSLAVNQAVLSLR
ncbi:MAG: hypothetical protein R3C61_28295 [Bacteroidia bacterium]